MSVSAKFICSSKVIYAPSTTGAVQHNIVLDAVMSGEDNKSWSKWTPSGKLEMTITNPDAAEFFVPGKSYYLYFGEVPEVTSEDRRALHV